jgi:hypothetical protein
MAVFCAVSLMKASMSNDRQPTRAARGEILVWSSNPDDGGTLVSFFLLGASFVEQRWWTEAGGGDVKSCLGERCYAESCLLGTCYMRQIFHGGVIITTGKSYADLCHGDGLVV